MAVIRIGIDPNILLGPVTLAWHGVTIVLGIVIGALVASRWLRLRGLPTDPMSTFALLACIGGIVGARIFYLLEHDPAALLAPERLFSSHGFTFSTGGVILAALLILAVIWPLRHRLTRPGDAPRRPGLARARPVRRRPLLRLPPPRRQPAARAGSQQRAMDQPRAPAHHRVVVGAKADAAGRLASLYT